MFKSFTGSVGVIIFCLFFSYTSYGSESDIFGLKKYEPKGYVGEGIFLKETFYHHNKWMTTVTHIVSEELDPQPGPDIGIFGQFNLIITDFSGKFKSEVLFDWKPGILQPAVRVKGRGIYQIVVCGHSRLGIMDQKGRPVWTFNNTNKFGTMASGYLNQDGEPEYYAVTTALSKLNERGHEIWRKGENDLLLDVDICRTVRKEPLVVTSNFDGLIQFRNFNGKVVREWISEPKTDYFTICHWLGRDHMRLSQSK
ncbi:MAG: hypothetical protein GY795_37590 [Desulfobacterales bacterium]|nr:hypothetical protein [Desulfobacterales bacterium]